ncbi:MAG TPA: CDP-alcohol phosphatidyltransferase family protein, partial [bacterium]|nr:CDP-alcohol phosphatidyltransferase family protein [bacterium]
MNRESPSTVWTLPNLVTLARILLVPFFFGLTVYHYRALQTGENHQTVYQAGAVVVFIFILISDGLDGYLARRNNRCTPLGSLLDPVADKLFVISSFALLVAFKAIPIWLAVLVISKDVVLCLGWLLLQVLHYDSSIRPSRAGKATLLLLFLVVLESLLRSPTIFR